MFHGILSRRALATATIAIAASVGSVAGISLAQGGSAPTVASATNSQQPPGGILTGLHGVLTSLVVQGTINQEQANAVQQQADAGSIDPKQLVDSGTLTNAQMRTVANQIDHLKRSYAG